MQPRGNIETDPCCHRYENWEILTQNNYNSNYIRDTVDNLRLFLKTVASSTRRTRGVAIRDQLLIQKLLVK